MLSLVEAFIGFFSGIRREALGVTKRRKTNPMQLKAVPRRGTTAR
jgi:hypothetical protein